ncbi:hypothetical protein ACFPIJ_36325 [Dactylosporangium cerinum]|uniref:Uncharacterized protein n=1 Tax=Dactylosporangium cerinum TaxID=1434730 RepID=A0ABV9W869_9ACTN
MTAFIINVTDIVGLARSLEAAAWTVADTIRVILGNLTPEEVAERDAAARRRRERAEQTSAPADPQSDETFRQHTRRLELAAGISRVELRCHQDTWLFVTTWMQYGRYPAGLLSFPDNWWKESYRSRVTELEHDMREISLSGIQVAEILDRLAVTLGLPGTSRPIYLPRAGATDRALARRLYDGIGAIVDLVQPASSDQVSLPPIVIDDRPAALSNETGNAEI